MQGFDGFERAAAFVGVRHGLGLSEGLLAHADRLGERVLIELGWLRLPPPRRDFFWRDRDRLDAGLGDGKRRGRRAQRLEANLMRLIPGSGVMKTDAAATRKGAASK